MKTKTTITITFASVVAMMSALSAVAGPVALSDAQLDSVSGKSQNLSSTGGVDNTSVLGAVGVAGNVQVGYYQWSDDHGGDSSINKGGNIQSGDNSMVQQNEGAMANELAWGGASQAVTVNNADIGNDQVAQSWWIMYLGGF